MLLLQLFIEGERVDLFKDESVSITQSIKNVKDIDKIFTEFTKTFTLPASKTNNKIFKHYYRYNIVNGFDARVKVNATLEINNLPFKKGKIKLEGVDLKNRRPNTYRVTFFGSTVELSDIVGEDKLSSLDFSAYNLNYDAATVQNKLQAASSGNDIIVPLITHTQRLYYDSTNVVADSGNLYPWTTTNQGVKWNQLKYAIRVNSIIEAIEDKYTTANGYPINLEFSSDFFKNTSVLDFNSLYMWLHRKSGDVENLSGNLETESQVTNLTPTGTNPVGFINYGDRIVTPNNTQNILMQSMKVFFTTTSTDSYTAQVLRNGTSVAALSSGSGNRTLTVPFQVGSFYEIFVTSASVINFSSVKWTIVYQDFTPTIPQTVTLNYEDTTFVTSTTFQFVVSQQMPDMKVLEFLTGLFKMFNLTAYVDQDNSTTTTTRIKVEPLDDYYATFDTYDITDYVDTDKQVVDVALPYREIVFRFKDTNTFLANRYNQLANKAWGEIDYSTGESNLAGQLYKVEVPFSHFQFERLNDATSGALKNIMWGYSVNESQNSYKGAPLLFYPVIYDTGVSPNGGYSFVDDLDADGVAISSVDLRYANLPSNTFTFNSTFAKSNLNFFNEINEWTRDTTFTSTLFFSHYQDYIQDIFNSKRRLIKIKANLPIKIYLNLKLNDRLIYNDQVYKINEITTNLLTGESDIELLNVI